MTNPEPNPNPNPPPPETSQRKPLDTRLWVAAAGGVLIGVALGTMVTRLSQAMRGGQPCPGCMERAANDAIAEARIRQMLTDMPVPPPPPPEPPAPPTWAEARPQDAGVTNDATD